MTACWSRRPCPSSTSDLRPHYPDTLAQWRARFDTAGEAVTAAHGQEFRHAWRLYLAGSEAGFRRARSSSFRWSSGAKAATCLGVGANPRGIYGTVQGTDRVGPSDDGRCRRSRRRRGPAGPRAPGGSAKAGCACSCWTAPAFPGPALRRLDHAGGGGSLDLDVPDTHAVGCSSPSRVPHRLHRRGSVVTDYRRTVSFASAPRWTPTVARCRSVRPRRRPGHSPDTGRGQFDPGRGPRPHPGRRQRPLLPVARRLNPSLSTVSSWSPRRSSCGLTDASVPRVGSAPRSLELYFSSDLKGTAGASRRVSGSTSASVAGLGDSSASRRKVRGLGDVRGTDPPDIPARWRGHAYYSPAARPPGRRRWRLAGGDRRPRGASQRRRDPAGGRSGRLAAFTILAARGRCREVLLPYARALEERLAPRGSRRPLPSTLTPWVAGPVLSMPWFARDVVLDRMFLPRLERQGPSPPRAWARSG